MWSLAALPSWTSAGMGQTECKNQEIETALRFMTSQTPSSWSEQLLWVEYSHNTLTSSTTGLSPFQCVYGYQPPLFPTLERETSCPSVQAFIHRCRRTWIRVRAALLKAAGRYASASNRHHSQAPEYQLGQRVWLSTRDLPLRVESKKLAPHFIGPFEIIKIINPAAVRLKLPRSMRVHPTFHVSRIKPVRESALVPAIPPPPPPRSINRGLTYTVRRLLQSRRRGGVSNTSWTGKDTARRRDPGSLSETYWITTSSGSFISVTPINPPEPVISPDHRLHPPGHPSIRTIK